MTTRLKNKDIKPLREQLLKEQNGICALCKKDIEDPVLDHDHRTGAIRGTICRKCNCALGRFENGCIRSGRKDRIFDIAKNIFDYINIQREELHPSFKIKR